MSRSRTLRAGPAYGYQNYNGVHNYHTRTTYDLISTCTDIVAKGNGQAFKVDLRRVNGGIVNYGTPGASTCVVNHRCDGFPDIIGDSVYGHGSISDIPSDADLAAKLLAGTNPSRAQVELPVFVYELRELPDLLHREAGLIKELANKNLQYQFGIRPLVQDLLSLLHFRKEVKAREKELDALYDSGIRRKRRLWSGSSSWTRASRSLNSSVVSVSGIGDAVTAQEKWGFVEWFPDNKLNLSKADKHALAVKAILGLTVDFNTAWQAIPWSWFVDWCSNFGDVLIANRNLVGAHHGPIQLMTHTRTTTSYRFSTGKQYVSPCQTVRETKERAVIANVPLTAHLPILSWRQWSILGSIGVTHRLPRVH